MKTNLASDVLLGEQVLALVREDHVHLFGTRAADIRTEHHLIGRVPVEILQISID